MQKILPIALALVVLLSACTPNNSQTAAPALTDSISESVLVENTAVPKPTVTILPPRPTTTFPPTPEPTQMPIRFDLTGFRQFAVMNDYFAGLSDFVGEKTYTEFSSTLSPSGDQIAVAGCFGSFSNLMKCETSKSGFLIVLDANTGKLLNQIPLGDTWAGKVDFTSDGKSLLYATNGYKIALWNLATDQPGITLFEQPAPDDNYYPDVVAAPDGRSLAAVIEDKLYVWDPAGKVLFQAPAYKLMISGGLAYSGDGSLLTVFSEGHTGLDIYETTNWTLVQRIPYEKIREIAISPVGKFVAATNTANKTMNVWNVESGDQVAHLEPGNYADSIQFNPAGDLLVVAGMGDLATQDSYSSVAVIYETRSWELVDTLYSFTSDGNVEFNQDGTRMAMLGNYGHAIWGLPDENLQAGYDVIKQFQSALSSGDYLTAAALFEVNPGEEDYLTKLGIDLKNLPASFERLCKSNEIFCLPVNDLVAMGYDWNAMIYLVRLKDPDGGVFTSPKGAHLIFFYLYPGADGQPRVSYPPMD